MPPIVVVCPTNRIELIWVLVLNDLLSHGILDLIKVTKGGLLL